jgi:peptide deformylase
VGGDGEVAQQRLTDRAREAGIRVVGPNCLGVMNCRTHMYATFSPAPGIGIAANQVSVLNRVLVMDIAQREDDKASRQPIFMVNPQIIWHSEEPSIWEEGCLSIPGQFAEVQRPLSVRVKFLGYDGKVEEEEFTGLGSHCVQHEIDHLDGKLFIDYLSKLKRDRVLKKFAKLAKIKDTEA